MVTNVFQIYDVDSIDFISGTTLALASDYDRTTDLLLEITDDDDVLDGDLNNNDDGNDSNQFGILRDLDGNFISGSASTTVYSEFQIELTGSDGSNITLFLMEMDSNPGSSSGNGIVLGYLPSSPLDPDIIYTSSTTNTVPGNSPFFDDIEGAVCFTSTSYVETKLGPVQICDLEPGMQIRTRDNGYQPLRWIYKRAISSDELAKNSNLKPVKISARAFGPNKPVRDVHMSQQHRVLLRDTRNELLFSTSDILVPAKGLINDHSIMIDHSVTSLEYVHLLFDAHQIVYVDGIEAESFALGKWSYGTLTPEARAEIDLIFPELSENVCAPFETAYLTLTVKEAAALRGPTT